MKRLIQLRYLLPLLAISVMFTSCEDDAWYNVRGTGPVYSESRALPIHRDMYISVPADVYIYQSLVREVTIEAQANVLDIIESYVSNSELKIQLAEGYGLGRHERIRIYISSAMFNSIRLSGSVNLYTETPIVTDVLELSLSGSGEADVHVVANTVRASISGSSNMWFRGTTITEEFTISGSGEINAFDLLSETCDINISGSGNAEVSVAEFLFARISGSGSIYYRGNPDIDSRISGSGKIIRVN